MHRIKLPYDFTNSKLNYQDGSSLNLQTFHAYRCPACPMYLPIIVKDVFPDEIELFIKNSDNSSIIRLSGIENEAAKLNQLLDESGYVKCKTLPEKLW